jgi:hypothetical protein
MHDETASLEPALAKPKLALSVISIIEGAVFKKSEGQRSRRTFCLPASMPA